MQIGASKYQARTQNFDLGLVSIALYPPNAAGECDSCDSRCEGRAFLLHAMLVCSFPMHQRGDYTLVVIAVRVRLDNYINNVVRPALTPLV